MHKILKKLKRNLHQLNTSLQEWNCERAQTAILHFCSQSKFLSNHLLFSLKKKRKEKKSPLWTKSHFSTNAESHDLLILQKTDFVKKECFWSTSARLFESQDPVNNWHDCLRGSAVLPSTRIFPEIGNSYFEALKNSRSPWKPYLLEETGRAYRMRWYLVLMQKRSTVSNQIEKKKKKMKKSRIMLQFIGCEKTA